MELVTDIVGWLLIALVAVVVYATYEIKPARRLELDDERVIDDPRDCCTERDHGGVVERLRRNGDC